MGECVVPYICDNVFKSVLTIDKVFSNELVIFFEGKGDGGGVVSLGISLSDEGF
jgi:hypothetical protein